MPNNRLGDEQTISIPSRKPIANDPQFSVIRQLDGHIQNDDDESMIECDPSNPHTIGG